MLIKQFMRMEEFAGLPVGELRALAARAQVLCVPAGRWLVQQGRALDGFYYLLRGRIETREPLRRQRAKSMGRLTHFYPGCVSARTVRDVQILRIDGAQREFVLQRANGAPALASAELWLERFFDSHMMRGLHGADWQRVLGAFSARQHAAGAAILRQGDAAGECFVIEQGHAVVHDAGTTLCHLGPGDFFGEDALVLGCRRTADVTALQDVRLHAIEQRVFAEVLLERLVRFVGRPGQGVVLSLGRRAGRRAVAVTLRDVRGQAAELDPRVSYYVCGGSRRERALCALLLVQRGLRARPVADDAAR